MKSMRIFVAILLVFSMTAGIALAETARLGSARFNFSPVGILYKTSDYTVTTSDKGKTISVDATSANVNLTLPSVSDAYAGGTMSLKAIKTDTTAYTVTLTPATGDTIGGESTRVIKNANGWIAIHAGPGKDWSIDYESPYLSEDHELGTTVMGTPAYDASAVFEGATANAYETTITVVDPTADNTITIPNDTGATMLTSLTTQTINGVNAVWGASNSLVMEGATQNDFETSIVPTDPTADRTLTLPDSTGTIATTTGTGATSSIYSAAATTATLTSADCGKLVTITTGTVTVQLPATVAGCTVTVVNGVGGAGSVTIDPNIADNIYGGCTLAASVVTIDDTAGDSVTNTTGTAVKGDFMRLSGDGDVGWYITGCQGIWAED